MAARMTYIASGHPTPFVDQHWALAPPNEFPLAPFAQRMPVLKIPLPPGVVPLPPPPFHALPAGTRLVAGHGFSTVLPDMDFETYSEAGFIWDAAASKWASQKGTKDKGLTVAGAARYAEHPTTEVLSFAYDLKDGRGPRQWRPGMPNPAELFDYLARGGLVEAWNSGFEWYVWNYVCTWRYGWPALRLESLRCAMAKSRAHAWPGALGKAGDVLSLQYRKDADGDRLLKKFSIPRNPTKTDPRARIRLEEDPVDGPALLAYNVRDIVTEAEASSRTPDLEGEELEFWLLDQRINRRGVQIDTKAVQDCIAIVDQAHAQYNAELFTLTVGQVARASELAKLQRWVYETSGVRMESMDEEAIEHALNGPNLPPLVRRALEIRARVGSASVKKIFAMANQVTAGGRLHDLFTYYGARTGRTTGNGPQPTNLPKAGPELFRCACGRYHGAHLVICPWCQKIRPPTAEKLEWTAAAVEDALAVLATRCLATVERYFGDAMLTISGCLRGLFLAYDGGDLICSDYSAIEAVVLAMLAGVKWREEVFRTHGKIYEASAAMMAKMPVEDVIAYKKIHGKHHPLRDKGKRAELACGYGGWVNAWKAFGADKYMTEEEMKVATLEWRAASPEIPEFWGGQWCRTPAGWRKELFGVEGMFVAAVMNPGVAYEFRGLRFVMRGDALYLRLLSGRSLVYHRPRLIEEDKFGRTQFSISYEGWNSNPKNGAPGWIRIDTYGGRLTENIVQATARDIQWHGMLNLERAGYSIVLHVYDEDAAEVPQGFGSIEEFETIMSRMPPWAANWPIKASGGWRGKRYRKD